MFAKNHPLLSLAASAGLALAFGSTQASAQTTLLSESFSGDGSASIVGALPDTGSSAWTGSSQFKNDGTTIGGTSGQSAYLAMPSAVVAGEIYSLTATFAGPGWPSTGSEPLRVGLAVGNLDSDGTATGGQPRPDAGAFDAMVWSNGRGRLYPDSSGDETGFDPGTIVDQSITMRLDTQTNPADYQLSFWTGGVQIGSTFNIGVQAFDHLWIGHERPTSNTDDMYFDQVTLTQLTGSDSTAPMFTSLAPANGAGEVPTNAQLVITFDEDVQKGSGDIVIAETGGSVFETIPVGDARITVSDAVVTIDTNGTFANSTVYNVQIDSGAIENLSGNDFDGIDDTTTWSFTTAAVLVFPLVENFSGLAADQLVGTPTGDGNNWMGSTTFRADGTTAGEQNRHAHLSLRGLLSQGGIYTLSATFTGPGWGPDLPLTTEQFLAIGFSEGGATSGGGGNPRRQLRPDRGQEHRQLPGEIDRGQLGQRCLCGRSCIDRTDRERRFGYHRPGRLHGVVLLGWNPDRRSVQHRCPRHRLHLHRPRAGDRQHRRLVFRSGQVGGWRFRWRRLQRLDRRLRGRRTDRYR